MNPVIEVMNVLFDDRFGGPSKRVMLVARETRDRGLSTTLVLPEGRGNAEEIVRKEGLPVIRLPIGKIPRPGHWLQAFVWLVRLPFETGRFLGLFRRRKPDVVHVNGAFFLAPGLASRAAGIPLVWHLNDIVIPRSIAPFLGALVSLLAGEVLVSSRAVGRHYKVRSKRTTVLYPPVDVEKIVPRRRPETAADPRAQVRIGLIANWNPIKGVEHFVRAAAHVHAALGDRLGVVLAGARLSNQVEYQELIDGLIDELGLRPRVTDLGFVLDVSEVLKELDIVVMSSTSEAVSMAVLEAMAAGLPVVASDVGGVKELILRDPDRPSGLVVPPADPEALAEAILKLAGDPQLARSMGEIGRQRAEECFSITAAADRHLEVYRRVVQRRGAGEGVSSGKRS